MDAGMETGERVEGLEGVASLMDALMRAGGDELDYESLLAVSHSMQLSIKKRPRLMFHEERF